jgi:hypothetical protein
MANFFACFGTYYSMTVSFIVMI